MVVSVATSGSSTSTGNRYRKRNTSFRLVWSCIMNVGWREKNQQDATNPMFIIKLLSQHVSGIIMPIMRRIRVCTAAYGVLHWLWWLWFCGAGTRAVQLHLVGFSLFALSQYQLSFMVSAIALNDAVIQEWLKRSRDVDGTFAQFSALT